MATQLAQMGVFNLKLIEHNNGLVEVRTYSEPVGNKPISISEEEMRLRQIVGRMANKIKTRIVYNPFSEANEEMIDMDDVEELERKKKRSEQNSYKRTVQKVYEITRQCKWEYFITLTFDGSKVDRYDYDVCMKKANKWFHNQRRVASCLQYMFVPEQHKDGAWHIHGLVAQVGDMVFTDSGKRSKGMTIYNLSGWKYGFSTATKVTDTHKVSSYVTKYITKDLCGVTKGKKRYYRSQNIPEPIEHEFMVQGNEKEAYVQMLADSLGVELEYQKDVNGYVDVSYKYFKKSEVSENE